MAKSWLFAQRPEPSRRCFVSVRAKTPAIYGLRLIWIWRWGWSRCSGIAQGGVRVLAEDTDRKPRQRIREDTPKNDAAMGVALRSVYQRTVEEQVPDEFLDLLGKLD